MHETSFLQWLQEHRASGAHLIHGIGDDAAVLNVEEDLVVTTDLIAEGTHFTRQECTLAEIGRKALAVNLSDLAAMAARPVAAFVSLLIPRDWSESEVRELTQGMHTLAGEYGCPVAGGDTNVWAGALALNVAVLGKLSRRGPLLRSGAQRGDRILVTGHLGGSRKGHHYQFVPRIEEAWQLHTCYKLHAGMDLSDGLALDLRRLCAASGCGAELDAGAIPLSAAVADQDAEPALKAALGDGEDFELLLTTSGAEAERILRDQPLTTPITCVGEITSGAEIWMRQGDQRQPLPALGFAHQSRPS